jgi:hypothetical protein
MVFSCIGIGLLFSLVFGGTYLYVRIEELDRMITRQKEGALTECEDDNG